jgi:hypothetical protein
MTAGHEAQTLDTFQEKSLQRRRTTFPASSS